MHDTASEGGYIWQEEVHDRAGGPAHEDQWEHVPAQEAHPQAQRDGGHLRQQDDHEKAGSGQCFGAPQHRAQLS